MNARRTALELDRLWAASLSTLLGAMERLGVAIAERERPCGTPEPGDVEAAQIHLASVIQGVMVVADMLGRRSVLRAADAHGMVSTRKFAAPWDARTGTALIPHVRFDEMVADMIAREPRLAQSAEAVSRLYGTEHAFAAARSAEIETTKRIQAVIRDAMSKGGTTSEASAEILSSARAVASNAEDWTRAYAETVFRTNASTAASAGRFSQMADPDVHRVIGAFRYSSANDGHVRPNHHALDGLIAAADDPVWHKVSPPLGYNCRCGLDFVSWDELKRMRLLLKDGTVRPARIPNGAGPDPGFKHGGNPAIGVYLGMM